MNDQVPWKDGDIANFHILLRGEWIPLTPKLESDGPWNVGDLVNGHVWTGVEWLPAPPWAFQVYPAMQNPATPRWPGPSNIATTSEPVRLSWRERLEAKRRAGRKPRKPRRQRARSARVGLRPPSTIWDISSRCVKCGRPLTNPNSQRHRVGTECIKRYGSQARRIPNPAFVQWSQRKARADADRIAEQAHLDAEYARQLAEYEATIATWRALRSGL